MPSYAVSTGPANRLRLGLAGTLLAAAVLGGCAAKGVPADAVALAAVPANAAGLRDDAEAWRQRHEADPADTTASINYARALRGQTRYAQAVAVLEAAAVKNPYDRAVLAAYGKALADAGRFQEARDVLSRAHTPDRPDWSVLSAQGAVADQLGDHADAIGYYEAALKVRPGEPSVLSNLGLSYALVHDLPRAEDILRGAAADPRADARVRQNYALVLSLQGRYAEAEQVSRRDLPPAEAAASVDAIRRMTAEGALGRGGEPSRPARRSRRSPLPVAAREG